MRSASLSAIFSLLRWVVAGTLGPRVLAGYIDNLPEVLFQTGTKRDELIANPVRAPHQLMN
jgi:hypothetical protein